jgi:hypothetical protein
MTERVDLDTRDEERLTNTGLVRVGDMFYTPDNARPVEIELEVSTGRWGLTRFSLAIDANEVVTTVYVGYDIEVVLGVVKYLMNGE